MPETRHYCQHCGETVSLSTLSRHKLLYFDEKTRTWTKIAEPVSSDSCEESQEPDYHLSDSHSSDADEGTSSKIYVQL